MNPRTCKPVLLALALAATPAAFAAAGDPPAEDYHFGSRPDIAQVLRAADLDFCGIREVETLYQDHQGRKHLLRYPVWGRNCPSEN
ncbi:DUF2790 domain-containing protein [Pseudomonas citronellolis]|uniref:DUF2790 domain-containing protein n=1 Tax=Pseudomonas citronellolis TaxID=53408 RepID=UPI0023E3AB70|nr:DUF2790 domain-containing protein [Pseudomonas citronellolis]MDF3933433.1 DUF2790 domain-containing protein [Pseudomonas citronellolis]